MSSLVDTYESRPGGDGYQSVHLRKAALVADGLAMGQFSSQSWYQGCVWELLSKRLTGRQEDHLSERPVWEKAALLLARFTCLV